MACNLCIRISYVDFALKCIILHSGRTETFSDSLQVTEEIPSSYRALGNQEDIDADGMTTSTYD